MSVFEQTKTIKSWDDDYYHPIAERYYDEAVPNMLSWMGAQPGDAVLDAGCGPGVHTIRAAAAGYKVTGIDISMAMLRTAATRVADANVGRNVVALEQEDLTKLSLADASFRYVFSWGVIIHIREAEKALAELARVVSPGGALALYVTNNDSWDKKIEDAARGILRKPLNREKHELGTGVWYDMNGEKLWVWQFDIAALTRAMERHGFRMTQRIVGEYSDLQRRTGGRIRNALLKANNALYRARVSPRHAVANLLIFRKPVS